VKVGEIPAIIRCTFSAKKKTILGPKRTNSILEKKRESWGEGGIKHFARRLDKQTAKKFLGVAKTRRKERNAFTEPLRALTKGILMGGNDRVPSHHQS